MKTINIYALTRINSIGNLQRLERQMSQRTHLLTIKQWEIEGLRCLVENLESVYDDTDKLQFFYSFQMPKLGKEFDLLRISDDTIINIELKSEPIPDEGIRKQLMQNRYYLSYLGKNMRSYTYISKENRLVRLTNSEKLIEVDFEVLKADLMKQTACYESDIEHLFKEENYIISPLADSERFLNKEYFLTSQQKDIAKKIMNRIKTSGGCYQGFTGLPGTGKTLLLYDIAMSLSYKQKVCIFHGGSYSVELDNLDKRLKRIDFYQGHNYQELPNLDEYKAILVDEAHLISTEVLRKIVEVARDKQLPMVLSYASESSIALSERKNTPLELIYALPDYEEHKLTNRIRANGELSSFIQCLMEGSRYNHRKDYPSVAISYANNATEACRLLDYYRGLGYLYIKDGSLDLEIEGEAVDIDHASCMESDCVVMIMDAHFMYDDEQGLISRSQKSGSSVWENSSIVRNLFHGLNRAKSQIALVIMDNESVCDTVLSILQGKSKTN